MSTKPEEIKSRVSFRWIKASDSGKTYLCPAGAVTADGAKDAELRRYCMDESLNPHND